MTALTPPSILRGTSREVTTDLPYTPGGTIRFIPDQGLAASRLRSAADGSGHLQFTLAVPASAEPRSYAFTFEPQAKGLRRGAVLMPARGELAVFQEARTKGTPRRASGRDAPGLLRGPDREACSRLSPDRQWIYESYFLGPWCQTELRAWNGLGGDLESYNQSVVISSDLVDLNWRFQWTTTDGRAKSMVWQIAYFDFPQAGRKLYDPPGLLAQGEVKEVPKSGGRCWFNIDLARAWEIQLISTQAENLVGSVRRGAFQADFRGSSERPPARDVSVPGAPLARIESRFLRPVRDRLYVRLILLDAQGKPVGVPSNSVTLTFSPPEPAQIHMTPSGSGHPVVKFVDYIPLRPDAPDCLCIIRIIKPWPTGLPPILKPGDWFDICAPKDVSVWDRICGTLSGFSGPLGILLDCVSDLYASAKNAVIQAVIDSLRSTVGCGELCQSLTARAVEWGLASMGMPPNLPSFHEIATLGAEYLAANVVREVAKSSQGFGIPEDAARKIADAFVAAVQQPLGSGREDVLYVPDPARQYRPAVVVFEVENQSGGGLSAELLIHDAAGLFKDANVPLYLERGQRFKVPVALEPVDSPYGWKALLPVQKTGFAGALQYLAEKDRKWTQAQAALTSWTEKYGAGTAQLRVYTLAYSGSFNQMNLSALGPYADSAQAVESVHRGIDPILWTRQP